MDLNDRGRRLLSLSSMLRHEENPRETHYGAHLSHWYGDAADIQLDAGALRALLNHYTNAKRYMLVSVSNREIRTAICPTLEKAQEAMLAELERAGIKFPSIGMVGSDFEVFCNSAHLTRGEENRDWLIAEVPWG